MAGNPALKDNNKEIIGIGVHVSMISIGGYHIFYTKYIILINWVKEIHEYVTDIEWIVG